jgi:tRNA modification GTPase
MNSPIEHRCQLLTPPGAGAIAIIRVTGPDPANLVDTLFRSTNEQPLIVTPPSRVRYGLINHSGEVIDDVVAYRFATGKTVAVELCCHGGIRVVERVLEALGDAGAPLDCEGRGAPVWTGANRIEQEALDLLPRARTRAAVIFLAWQRENTVHWLQETAHLCASDPIEARDCIESYLARSEAAKRIVHGATVALVGPPNSGKSTLFNRLVGRDAAIVSSVEGTTRDWVTASIEILGIALTLIDTAGQRPDADQLEKTAIDTGRDRASCADLTIVVLDGSIPLTSEASYLLTEDTISDSILALNKCDIASASDVSKLDPFAATTALETVCVSAKDGIGIPGLLKAVGAHLGISQDIQAKPAAFSDRQVEIGRLALDLLEHDAGAAARAIEEELIPISG